MFQEQQILSICTNSVDLKTPFQSQTQALSFLEKFWNLEINLSMPGKDLLQEKQVRFSLQKFHSGKHTLEWRVFFKRQVSF